jgi:hypothetical protein
MTTTTTFQSVLDWALFYHREGLSVIPLKCEPASDRKNGQPSNGKKSIVSKEPARTRCVSGSERYSRIDTA